MSFQMYKSLVLPSYWSNANLPAHQSRTVGEVTSRYAELPGQHHPSKSVRPSAFFT